MHRSRVRSIEFDDRWMQMRARSRHARTRGHTVGRTHAYTRSVGHTHAHVRVLYHEIVPCVRCVTLTHTHARARPHSTVCDLSMRTHTYPTYTYTYTCGSTARRFAALALARPTGFATRASVSRARTVGFRFHRERETTTRELFFFVLLRILCLH